MKRLLLLLSLCHASLAVAQTTPKITAEAAKGFKPLSAALHVHSRFSDGEYDLPELASLAHDRKIDVLGITDSFLTKVRYGIEPFRKLLSITRSRQGVLDRGITRFLQSAATAQHEFPDVVLIPGLEVAPYYYWTGSPGNNLKLYEFDRHLLVFGLTNVTDIANLPVIENATWTNTARDWRTAVGPVLCFMTALFCLILPRRFSIIAGLSLGLIALAWTYDAYPFGVLPNPYTGRHDFNAAQRTIDYVNAKGGLSFWSYPEAGYPDERLSGATMVSRSDPQVLTRTQRYSGFEGLYGGRITVTRAGNLWDQILMDYSQGGRKEWPSVITGLDFHYFQPGNGWYELNHGITVLFAESKDARSIMDAIRKGRGYASFEDNPSNSMLLRNFALSSRGQSAIAGETLQTTENVELTADIDSENAPENDTVKTTAELIRDGSRIDEYVAPGPIHIRRQDSLERGPHYYRLVIQHGRTEIVSNPIFCRVQEN